MSTHFDLTDEQFESQFKDGSLSPSLFNHEAHLRLAYIHLRNYGVEQACQNLCQQIKAYDNLHGDGTVYHETLTVAAARAVYHFMQQSKVDSFQEFIIDFPRLKTNFKDLMDCHYSFNLITSEVAKKENVEPDLLPFS